MTYNGNTTLGCLTYAGLTETTTEVLCNVTQGSSNSDIAGVCLLQSGSGSTFNMYYADIGNVAGKVEIGKCVNNTFTSLTSATFSSSFGTKYSIRFNFTSGTLKVKIWQASGAEPGPFTATITDSSLTSGLFGVIGAPVGSSNCKYDTFSATNGATSVTHLRISDGMGGVFS